MFLYSTKVNGPRHSSRRSAAPNVSTPVARTTEVSSVRKALELLGCFTPQAAAWGLSDLARSLKIPKSTAHNLLRTLQSFDFVRQDAGTRVYRLGPRALELGLVFARGSDVLAHARTVMNRLAERTGETVKVGILSSGQVLIVAAVESTHQLHTRGDAGTRWPLHSSSLGKAILSKLPPEEAEEILSSRGMARFTDHTLTTWPDIEREIRLIRARGYSLDQEENEPGVCCVAAPVTDVLHGVVAAISISGPAVRLHGEVVQEFAKHVLAASRAIARQSIHESL